MQPRQQAFLKPGPVLARVAENDYKHVTIN